MYVYVCIVHGNVCELDLKLGSKSVLEFLYVHLEYVFFGLLVSKLIRIVFAL